MRFLRTVLFLLSIATCAVSGVAQSQHWRGKIPFSFQVGKQTFPPGVYDVLLDVDRGYVTFAGYDHPQDRFIWIGLPSGPHSSAIVRFGVAGDEHFLRSVAVGSWEARISTHTPRNLQEASIVFPK